MPSITASERKALLFLAALLALGTGTRLVVARRDARPPTAAERAALGAHIAAVESARARESARPRGRRSRRSGTRSTAAGKAPRAHAPAERREPGTPLAAPIDLDLATAAEIEALPGIGPTLAGRIVADRDSLGPFGSLEGLTRVKGVGPALARRVQAQVTFSRAPRPPNAVRP